MGLHLTHLHLKFFMYSPQQHPEIISHPSVLTHQGAFDTCSRHNQALFTLPSSAQYTEEAHGSPVITPTTAPSSNLPQTFKTRPGILSYSASRRHSTRPIRYRPRHRLLHTSGLAQQFFNPPKTTPPPLQFTTDISFLYTEDLLIHALPNLPLLAAQLPATISQSLPSI
ncbi:hypothetical protein Fcan01_26427 [Folsomia candida]|uniref:Uncharacterized protein n=1 Tax=Folsomia candida TaxID=158441 RepID=A0A226D0S6_FOLCA|nr:hypothetical protein Fcan01_26427 [Folsomia candida]